MIFPVFLRKPLFLKVFLMAVLGVSGGCATLPAPGPEPGAFVLRGTLGIVQPEDSFSARFLWQQQAARFDIDLWGPFGQGRLGLEGDARQLGIRDAGGALISRGPHEQVMTRHLGWSLPLAVLPEWVQGRPDARWPVASEVYDEAGRLTEFLQLGWHVTLERFRPVAGSSPPGASLPADAPATAQLPHRVTASRDAYRVRLAISGWQF